MSAAAFVLAINLFVAIIFASAFGIVAAYARSAVGARWLAIGYGVGTVGPILEFLLPVQADPRPMQIMIFVAFLVSVSLAVAGLARHYRLTPPWRTLGALILVSLLINVLTIEMPRQSMLRALLYQLPYFTVYLVGVITVLRFRRRQALDQALVILLAVSALHFLAKPILGAALGTGSSAQTYMSSTYAAVSQSLSGMLMIASGVLMLLIIVRDAMAEMTERSETDKLSGLLNRRGFEDRADRLLATTARTGVPGTMIVADLDHFKSINDNHGHEAGDRVIAAFARVLVETAATRAVIGRQGGEEFAVFIPNADLAEARLYAEGVRASFASLSIASLGPNQRVSASFGVAPQQPGDSLSDLLRRTDAALYEAKKSGRDRVCVVQPDVAPAATEEDSAERLLG